MLPLPAARRGERGGGVVHRLVGWVHPVADHEGEAAVGALMRCEPRRAQRRRRVRAWRARSARARRAGPVAGRSRRRRCGRPRDAPTAVRTAGRTHISIALRGLNLSAGNVRRAHRTGARTWLTSTHRRSRTTSSRTGSSRRRLGSRSTASPPAPFCTTRRIPTTRASGRGRPPTCSLGRRTGTRSVNGSCRSPSGSSAVR